MRKVKYFFIVISLLFLSGCHSLDPEQRDTFVSTYVTPHASAAITLNIQAAPDLNAFDDLANSCSLLVLQATDKNVLTTLLKNKSQLALMFNRSPDLEVILQSDKYVVMPGQKTTLHVDRAEGSKVVAVVAGYYPGPDIKNTIIENIPVNVSNTAWWGIDLLGESLPLKLDINMGKKSMTRIN